MTTNETRTAILDAGRDLLQTRGYNAFSFRDLAERVRVKSASVHYHFPTKGDLGLALIARQREMVREALDAIDAGESAADKKLERYVQVFRRTLDDGDRMCLCGMMAADVATLEPEVIAALRESFLDHESWLKRVLTEGRKAGQLRLEGGPQDEARLLLAALEGAMLIARAFGEPARFEAAARRLLARFSGRPAP